MTSRVKRLTFIPIPEKRTNLSKQFFLDILSHLIFSWFYLSIMYRI